MNAHEFYRLRKFPETARRMEIFEKFAPGLARKALDGRALSEEERRGVTHVIVICRVPGCMRRGWISMSSIIWGSTQGWRGP